MRPIDIFFDHEQDYPDLDVSGAVERLSQTVQCETINCADPSLTDLAPFDQLHNLIRSGYPHVMAAGTMEVLGRRSLLITLPGSDPDLRPCLFMSHQDVVPVVAGTENDWTYHYMELPMKDTWGVLMQRSSPLAEKDAISPQDLWDKPLILSRQVDNKSGLYRWLGKEPTQLHTVATYNLIYNASLMVDEGMGYAFTLDKLVNTTGSGLCFRPLKPRLELGMYLVWKKSQIFSRSMELFQEKLKENLSAFRENGE